MPKGHKIRLKIVKKEIVSPVLDFLGFLIDKKQTEK